MKTLILTAAILATHLAHANPFEGILQRDIFTPNYAEYNVDGLSFVIDATENTKRETYLAFEDKCLNHIPQVYAELFENLKNFFPDLNTNDFNYETFVIKTQDTSINGIQLSDYMCRIKVNLNPSSKYTIGAKYSEIYKGKKSEKTCQAEVTKQKANQLKMGLLGVHYHIQYKENFFGNYKPEYGIVVSVLLKANPFYQPEPVQPEPVKPTPVKPEPAKPKSL